MLVAAVRWSVLAQSGHSRQCNILSAIGQERTLPCFGCGAVCQLMMLWTAPALRHQSAIVWLR